MLMEYLDITSSGTYDFFYLRIDFQNKCKFFTPNTEEKLIISVGYAFINFFDAASIVPFAKARVGTKWSHSFPVPQIFTVGIVSIPIKSAIFLMPIFKEKNVSLRNSVIVV